MSRVVIQRFDNAHEVVRVDRRGVPARGWAIVANTDVYKDGTCIGQLVQFETTLEGATRPAHLMYLPIQPDE